MAKITFKKGDKYLLKLSRLEHEMIKEVCGPAIYDAAGLVADSIMEELKKIPTDEKFGTPENPTIGPHKAQKKALEKVFGITKMEKTADGFLNVKIGFDGYNDTKTKRWPKGQPNQMIARAVESGTSFMRKNPFVKTGVAKARKKAMAIMKKKVQEGVEKIMK